MPVGYWDQEYGTVTTALFMTNYIANILYVSYKQI